MKIAGSRSLLRCLPAVVALVLAGCSASPAPPAAPGPDVSVVEVNSGYLGDYSLLTATSKWPTILAWKDSGLLPQRILVRPVEIWRSGQEQEIPAADLPYVAEVIARAMRHALANSFELASAPGAGVLELRVAMTHARAGEATRKHAAQSAGLGRRTGPLDFSTRDFVRVAAFEAELLDPSTGKPVAAIVDRRAADELPKGAADSWEDLLNASSLWGERVRAVLAGQE